ncbi:MAG: aspartate ammonia-lyase [Anaeromyxobacteraceae bacterium]
MTHVHRFVAALLGLALALPLPARAAGARIEHDSLGDREIPAAAYWGAQTSRALENFPFDTHQVRHFPNFIVAYAYVKKAAALANHEVGALPTDRMKAIVAACDELIAGKLHDEFVIDMMQGGAGTSTNMNVNEVVANRGLELMGHRRGEYRFLHPNDDVNLSQSTNDNYPTAAKLAVLLQLRETQKSLEGLRAALGAKGVEFADVIKMGRTEMQDAVPVTLGQEFAGFADTLNEALVQLGHAREAFYKVNLGGTAIGTGLNSPPRYGKLAIAKLAELTGFPFVQSRDLVGASSDGAGYIEMSGALKRTGIAISKVANDLRLMSSGPRTGFYEITLPAMQPGSSIMPGKVNPVIPEVTSSIVYQLAGYDTTVTMAAELSSLELNPVECVIVYDLLSGAALLEKAARVFTEKCVIGVRANRERNAQMVRGAIGLVTALNPVLGYEKSAAIAKEALASGRPVYDLVLEKGLMTKEALNDMLKPENMTQPREWPAPK